MTLGEEVAQIISGDFNAPADTLLVRNITYPLSLEGYPVLFLPHPDACRRFEKWRVKIEEGIRIIKSFLNS